MRLETEIPKFSLTSTMRGFIVPCDKMFNAEYHVTVIFVSILIIVEKECDTND